MLLVLVKSRLKAGRANCLGAADVESDAVRVRSLFNLNLRD